MASCLSFPAAVVLIQPVSIHWLTPQMLAMIASGWEPADDPGFLAGGWLAVV